MMNALTRKWIADPRTPPLRLAALFALAATLCMPLLSGARAEDSGSWADIRASVFGEDTPIAEEDGVITLETPYRALDAATVPVRIGAGLDQSQDRYIRRITLIIDENPAPVVGTFELSPDNGIASLSTRVRVNAYTNIRAVAELDDGSLHMASRYVKASGGCSAPAGKDAELAASRMGKMKLRQIGAWAPGQPSETQFMVSHPNYSGMQTDQVTHLWIPAQYVRTIELSLGERKVLEFNGDISMSENPSVRFFVKPQEGDVLHARVTDSEDRVFEQSWPVKLEPAS